MPRHLLRSRAALATSVALAAALTLTACGSGGTSGGGGSGGDTAGGTEVLASFYPLQFVAERVGGERVSVSNLTPPAAEPHDLELSPAQARSIGTADLVVYQSGFQAAVDEAVEARDPAHLVDATQAAGLEEHPGEPAATESGSAEDEHATHDDHADDGHDHSSEGGLDPHFWLDPSRLVPVAEQVAAELTAVDPDGADEYAANLEALTADLTALDAEYEAGLASCVSPYLVTSHEAFGYLAERYGLEQVGITGIDPEAEPSPARLREVADIIRDHGVSTIFFETLTSPKVTQTLAQDVGVQAAVLDPLEGLSKDGTDYLGVMRTNLEALRTGLTCA
ncbi:metal ABC transporter substrate-binding protein [Oerskovia sp. KBS0722]|uniref:metal ABC transporter substrate-binding protein n=1 Tax=Oerskovia sp. KBS0722 TaxID=1179673 RepID=UPI00110F514B|nr:metal ABC transporter substrate-binding protein [Oerskovia sp. KBS0722]QDW63734.1 zinc ABC transporter substrate-binding protein [Oerskovia sp. KBS0722]